MAYNGPVDPEKNAVHVLAATFREHVENRASSRIQIVLYPHSQPGNPHSGHSAKRWVSFSSRPW
jgi:TRAP-type C4-dicarboxylate transport system substrate-binding protein